MNISRSAGIFYSASPKQTPAVIPDEQRTRLEQRAAEVKVDISQRQPGRDVVEISCQAPSVAPPRMEQFPCSEWKKLWEPKESTQFTNADVSEAARKLSSLMDENDTNIEVATAFGMSEEQLAEHFGSIGKQIDDAFSAGEISEQEYNDLNKGLETYSEAIMTKAERSAAGWELAKQISKATLARINQGASDTEMADYAKKLQDSYQDTVSEFVKSSCSINRSLMSQLLSRVRGGESLFPAGTEQVYGRHNVTGYFKNGYIPAAPTPYP